MMDSQDRSGPASNSIAATAALLGWNLAMALSIRQHLRLLPGVLAAWPAKTQPIVRRGVAAE